MKKLTASCLLLIVASSAMGGIVQNIKRPWFEAEAEAVSGWTDQYYAATITYYEFSNQVPWEPDLSAVGGNNATQGPAGAVATNIPASNGISAYVAFGWDSTEDYYTLPDAAEYDFDTNDVAISLWFRSSKDYATADGYYMNDLGVDAKSVISLQVDKDSADHTEWRLRDEANVWSDVVDSSVAWQDNRWHHLLVQRYKSTNLNLHIDGVLRAAGQWASPGDLDLTGGLRGRIGSHAAGTHFMVGLMGRFVIYKGQEFSTADCQDQWWGTCTNWGAEVYDFEHSDKWSNSLCRITMDGVAQTVRDWSVVKTNHWDLGAGGEMPLYGSDGTEAWFTLSSDRFWPETSDWMDLSNGTFSCWLYRIGTSTNNGILRFGHINTNEFRLYAHMNGSPLWQIYRGGSLVQSLQAPSAIATNAWHHLALTWTNGVQAMYIDGSVVTSSAYANMPSVGTLTTNVVGVAVSGHEGSYRLDDAGVWSEVFTAGDVSTNYSATSGTH